MLECINAMQSGVSWHKVFFPLKHRVGVRCDEMGEWLRFDLVLC
jgi:hypothetical protein